MDKDYNYSQIEIIDLETNNENFNRSSLLLDAYALIPANDSDGFGGTIGDYKTNFTP